MVPGYAWTKVYESAEAIEQDLNGFEFKGEGWYETLRDTVLILDVLGSMGEWKVYCWNETGVVEKFKNLPVYTKPTNLCSGMSSSCLPRFSYFEVCRIIHSCSGQLG